MRQLINPFSVCIISVVLFFITLPDLEMGNDRRIGAVLSDIKELNKALVLYVKDTNAIPLQESGINELITNSQNLPNWKGPYLKKLPHDAWNVPYIYKVNDYKKSKFLIYSSGPNRQDDQNTGDDVSIENSITIPAISVFEYLQIIVFFLSTISAVVSLLIFAWRALMLIVKLGRRSSEFAP
mgnify:FL=1